MEVEDGRREMEDGRKINNEEDAKLTANCTDLKLDD